MQDRTVPTVSVVMPAYNAEKYLREAIDSILAQTFADFEFIIVNDGSTDRTKEIILSYSDPRIIYLENEHNSGICVTLNKGLEAARGRYIARMDADDISLPERFACQVKYMDAHPEIGVLGTDIEVFFSDGFHQSHIFHFDSEPRICRANLMFSATLAHPTAFIRKAVLDKCSIRYEEYYRGMEDHHMWWRIVKHANISNLGTPLLRYRQHSAQVTKNSTNTELTKRLRSFIRQRVCDYGVVLSNEEYQAFCLYLEDRTAFNNQLLNNFVSACAKIIRQLRKNKYDFTTAQRMVLGRAISFIIDGSKLGQKSALKYQFKAVMNGTMSPLWYLKRMVRMITTPQELIDIQCAVSRDTIIASTNENRYAFLMYYMNCGGVEMALASLLNRLDYDKNIVDLYMVEAKGEFLNRINKQVNIVDLTQLLHPVQKQLIVSQNIHSTIEYALKNGYYLRALKHGFLYALSKATKSECPAYRAAAVSNIIANFKYDKVFDFHGYASFTTFFGARKLKTLQRFTWCHSQNVDYGNMPKTISQYDKMFAVSSFIREKYESMFPLTSEIFYNFIDERNIKDRAGTGEKLPKTKGCINLLTVGRLSYQKGFDTALQVAQILKDSNYNFKWYFCGDGEEHQKLTDMAKGLHVDDCVVFMGFKDNPFGYMQSCDIYVQTSRYEGYALTLMEAVALGKIIVTTDVSGASEAVTNGKNGFIASQNPCNIASKLEILIKDSDIREQFGKQASLTILNQTESEKMFRKYIS